MFKSFLTYIETIFVQYTGLKYLFFLLIIIYIGKILKGIAQYLKLCSCLVALHDFLESYGSTSRITFTTSNERTSAEYKVLKKYPLIREFKSTYSNSLSYSNSSGTNYVNAVNLYNQFLMSRNDLIHDLKRSINPIRAVEQLFLLPSSIIRFIGFNPKNMMTKIINILVWTITFIINLYGEEIKILIESLLKQI